MGISSWATPDEVGSGIWVPLTAMALMGGGMPIPEGGSEKLAQALAQLIQDQGGIILTEQEAETIIAKRTVPLVCGLRREMSIGRSKPLLRQQVQIDYISHFWLI